MGRLFWKFFLLFSLAQITTAIVVGSYIRWEISEFDNLHSHVLAMHLPPQHPPLAQDFSTPLVGANHGDSKDFGAHKPWLPPNHLLFYWEIVTSFPVTALIVSLGISMLFAILLAWYVSKPIRILKEAFADAAQGHLQLRIADKMAYRADELAELGVFFDKMLARFQSLVQSRSATLHHVSHELRSPLARIHMALGLALQNPDKLDDSLKRLELEVHRMELMIAQLLEIERFQSGLLVVKREAVNVSDVLKTIVADASYESRTAKISLLVDSEQIFVYGQEDLLHRAVENVVRNAVKYTPPYTDISVLLSVSYSTGEAIIEVQDQGPGVPEEEMGNIFKPFIRGSASKQGEGHGIGLAITQHVVEAHAGYVVATNLNPTGFMVRIHLPLLVKA